MCLRVYVSKNSSLKVTSRRYGIKKYAIDYNNALSLSRVRGLEIKSVTDEYVFDLFISLKSMDDVSIMMRHFL